MPISYRVVFVDAATRTSRLEVYSDPEVLGPIDLGVKLHLEKYRSYEVDVFNPRNIVVIGRGVFAGGKIFGSHRLIAVFRSPQSRGLHVSAMGGAAYRFVATGVHAIVVEGRSEDPLIVFVEGDEKGFKRAWFDKLTEEELETIYMDYRGFRGIYALTRYLYDHYTEFFREMKARAIVVGPASLRTIHGGLFSIGIDPSSGEFKPGELDSAARGGGGSVLYQAHGVVAIVFGGSYDASKENPKLADTSLVNKITKEVIGKNFSEAVVEATKKYRYDPSLGTGGTFGVNYVHYRDLVPGFAFNTIYYGRALRLKIHNMIMEYFWKPFQVKVFEVKARKPWHTCGEPCPATCKKTWNHVKVDYEPFNAMGPMIGVLRFEDAIDLVELVDELGLDAIEAGHIVSWIFDLLTRGLLEPSELGLPRRPHFDPLSYNPLEHSSLNSKLARKILEALVYGGNEILELVAKHGIREASKKLNEKYRFRVKMVGIGFHDAAIYVAYGENGYITPNYYWAPGMIAPMYLLGRYWTNYSPTFAEPEALAETALRRALHELLIDNAGFCRFHRHWVEKVLEKLYAEIWGVKVDLLKHAAKTYKLIVEYQKRAKAEPQPLESKKSIDLVATIAGEIESTSWVEKFTQSPIEAAREWWTRFKNKLDQLLEEASK